MSDNKAFTCGRRTFLLGSAATVAGAFLAACGGDAPEEVASADVPVGSALILDKVIIAQPTPGNYVAYSKTCPHQSNPITVVDGDKVRCTKHNSVFAIADGKVLSGPSRDPLKPATVEKKDDRVIASL